MVPGQQTTDRILIERYCKALESRANEIRNAETARLLSQPESQREEALQEIARLENTEESGPPEHITPHNKRCR